MKSDSRIFVAGHRGMVGSAAVRRLQAGGFKNLLLPARGELDLTNQAQSLAWFQKNKPEVVFVAAAKVGGILANNTYPADFIRDNLAIALNSIESARLTNVPRLLFLGSSCIYPKLAPQPMTEDCLLTSQLEPTNEAYALAKIAGLKLCQYYRKQYGVLFHSAMPTNLYGPGDNYHLQNSHVFAAFLRKFDDAKQQGKSEVVCWGTGSAKREFLHVDDLADAIVFLLANDAPPDWVNVGTGEDISIKEFAEAVQRVVGFTGKIVWDSSKPDGTPRKLMDVSRLAKLGWKAKIGLEEGIRKTYAAYLEEKRTGTVREV